MSVHADDFLLSATVQWLRFNIGLDTSTLRLSTSIVASFIRFLFACNLLTFLPCCVNSVSKYQPERVVAGGSPLFHRGAGAYVRTF